jgi:hypothetical protein
MALPNLVFSVASEYDGKGLGKARKDVNSFDKTVKNLAKTVGVTLSAAAVVKFGKASVKAFLADDKAAATLTKTLGNLNLAFEDQRVRSYISSLEQTSGVLDSELRPAMQALLTTTGSVTKSQELLGLALDVAAGSGESLVGVSNDIAQAYVGNTKGLRKYNLGLTQTELKTASFIELQTALNKQFSGQNAAQLSTYAGQLSLIKVAYDNMQETIGKGLVDSFVLLSGDAGIGGATKAMETFGQTAADVILGVASLVDKITPKTSIAGEPGFWHDLYIAFGGQIIEDLAGLGQATRLKPGPFKTPMTISGQSTGNSLTAVEKLRAQAEAEALKRAKALAAAQKVQLANAKKLAAEAQKKLALEKASAVLNQANKLFDMDRIQLAAAAMAKQTEEDRVRIRLKTNILELEDAINEGNVQAAAKFASLITQDAALLGQLRGVMISLGDVPNPFEAWLASLQAALAALLAIVNFVPPTPSLSSASAVANASLQQGLNAGLSLADALSGARYAGRGAAAWNAANPDNPAFIPKMAKGGVVMDPTMALIGEAGPEAVIPLNRMGSMGGTYVTVNVSGSVTTERDLVDAITQGIYNNQAAGIPINYSTVY